MGNTAIGNLGEGFLASSNGPGYSLKLNTAIKNGTAGIRLDGLQRTARFEVIWPWANKGTDLVDEIPGCDNNDLEVQLL